ncbi:hypothetical protein Sjap_013191 [Stephania japonica]|uniref:Uncharacterized protein n=1 Tax=Stephania japonica TaxID=461633 RepID=A0AAP0IXF8_9MAGN
MARGQSPSQLAGGPLGCLRASGAPSAGRPRVVGERLLPHSSEQGHASCPMFVQLRHRPLGGAPGARVALDSTRSQFGPGLNQEPFGPCTKEMRGFPDRYLGLVQVFGLNGGLAR